VADVTNYTIENASGANVRIDLNNVFAAIQSSNSKSSDLAQSQCVAGMPFLNTTTNILKIRNSSNGGFTEIGNINTANLGLLPATGGTMTGALLGHDGSTASAPAFSFDTDTDLGLFRNAANVMGFSSSGTEQMIFSADGITLRSQNEIRFGDNDNSHYVAMKAGTTTANRTITLPDETGTLVTSTSLLTQLGAQNITTLRSLLPSTTDTFDLGSSSKRWANLYVNDLSLSNKGGSNDVDGTWGSYTIQEGHDDLFLINHKTGKKFKFMLQEVSQ